MTNKSIKKAVADFISKNKLYKINLTSFEKAAQNCGYTIIEFNSFYNDKDVETVISNLQIGEAVAKSRGFTYTDSNHRLIFINEGLNGEERLLVLAHELGHIMCGHFLTSSIIGNDVTEEYEANEFAHYLLKQGFWHKAKVFADGHKTAVITAASVIIAACIALGIGYAVKKEDSYYGNYYITSTGNKYHEKECVFVKDKTNVSRLEKEDFEAGTYKPCGMCLPLD